MQSCLRWRHPSHLFRHVNAVAVVVAESFIQGYFLPFRIDDSLGLVAVTMPLQKRIKMALNGAIVILEPAMHRQDKVAFRAIAMPLKEPNLC